MSVCQVYLVQMCRDSKSITCTVFIAELYDFNVDESAQFSNHFHLFKIVKIVQLLAIKWILISVILTNCEFVPILIHQNLCINRIKAIPSIYFYQFIIQHLNHVIIRMFKTIRKKLILFLFNHIGIFVVGYAVLYG